MENTSSDWHYRLWDEPQIVKMIEDYFPDFLNVFNSFDALIKKIDFAIFNHVFVWWCICGYGF